MNLFLKVLNNLFSKGFLKAKAGWWQWWALSLVAKILCVMAALSERLCFVFSSEPGLNLL